MHPNQILRFVFDEDGRLMLEMRTGFRDALLTALTANKAKRRLGKGKGGIVQIDMSSVASKPKLFALSDDPPCTIFAFSDDPPCNIGP